MTQEAYIRYREELEKVKAREGKVKIIYNDRFEGGAAYFIVSTNKLRFLEFYDQSLVYTLPGPINADGQPANASTKSKVYFYHMIDNIEFN